MITADSSCMRYVPLPNPSLSTVSTLMDSLFTVYTLDDPTENDGISSTLLLPLTGPRSFHEPGIRPVSGHTIFR